MRKFQTITLTPQDAFGLTIIQEHPDSSERDKLRTKLKSLEAQKIAGTILNLKTKSPSRGTARRRAVRQKTSAQAVGAE